MKPVPSLAAVLFLAACSDPLSGVARLSDVAVAVDNPAAAALPSAAEITREDSLMSLAAPAERPDASLPASASTQGASRGFLSRLLAPRSAPSQEGAAGAADGVSAPSGDGAAVEPATRLAAIDSTGTAEAIAPSQPRAGLRLFGALRAKPATPDAKDLRPGEALPFGKVARLCDVGPRQLGTEVARYPEKGRGFRIYDTAPGTTGPHTLYITGFADGCARQVTAALALFGSAEMHEQLRYGLPAKVQPYSTTDEAYDKLKSRVCGVPRQKPCGDRIRRMEKSTVFVSLYEHFGDNAGWSNLLLHKGEVLAQDFKRP